MKDENKVHDDAALVNLQGAGSVVRRRRAHVLKMIHRTCGRGRQFLWL